MIVNESNCFSCCHCPGDSASNCQAASWSITAHGAAVCESFNQQKARLRNIVATAILGLALIVGFGFVI